jgi:glycosyltransferase involved in cell wall biosynthesis
MNPRTVQPDLSIVIPVYNEAPNLEPLCHEFTEALERFGRSYELILVDDGSTDDSFTVLRQCQLRDPRIRVIQFRRNFGQTAAFAAGFAEARGRLIITADADLQNDPRDIPAMVTRLDEGYDIVCGWRKDRKDPWLNRRLPSELANRLISRATGVRLHDYGCSLKVFRADVVKPLKLYGEMHRFLPALASEMGVRIFEMPVNHRARTAGKSKYGISRTLRVCLDLITVKFLLSYSTRPLRIFGTIGAVLGVVGFGILAQLAWLQIIDHVDIGGQTRLHLGVLLVIMGVQFVVLGLLAEMLARTYHESQHKPTYVIRQILQADDRVARLEQPAARR